MDEREWLSSTDPQAMLAYLTAARKANLRKLRLLAVACAAYIGSRAGAGFDWGPVREVEWFADGQQTWKRLRDVQKEAWAACERAVDAGETGLQQARWVAAWAADRKAERAASQCVWGAQQSAGTPASEWLCKVVRDLFGNPFAVPPRIHPAVLAWQDATVVRLARSAYDERELPGGRLDPDRLSVLADALEEAGVNDPDILGHLREQGTVHVRGCFVLDLLLGKS